MDRSQVLKARKATNYIEHQLQDGTTSTYADIRGGISWPILGTVPAYFCIVGREWLKESRFHIDPPPEGKLHIIAECEYAEMSLQGFFDRLMDCASLYCCNTFYTITEQDNQGQSYQLLVQRLRECVYKKGVPLYIVQAPWPNNIDVGVYLIRDMIDRGQVEIEPGSIVYAQLKRLQPDDVKQLPEKLPAVNALRYVMAGLDRDKPHKPHPKDWRKHVKQLSWGRRMGNH